jgi:ADP-ribose pyrophosphatase
MGGRVDEGELPLEAAKRELLEETGLTSDTWMLWFASQPSNKIDRAIYVFVAKNCRQTRKPQTDAGEKISLELVSFDDFITSSKKPEFRDSNITIEIARTESEADGLEKLKKAMLG